MAIGAAAGFLGGSLGLGGGFLVVPALTSLLSVPPRRAIGTSAAVVLAVSAAACYAYIARGLASVRASAAIATAAVATAGLGATLTSRIDQRTLKKAFGGWLLVVSGLVGFKALGLLSAAAGGTPGASSALAPLVGLGGVTGFISGLLGVGGGTVLVPALTLGFGYSQPAAQGCALLGMVPPACVSTWTHWRKGNVDPGLAPFAMVGALAGGALGSVAAAYMPERALRVVFSLVLLSVGVKYLRG